MHMIIADIQFMCWNCENKILETRSDPGFDIYNGKLNPFMIKINAIYLPTGPHPGFGVAVRAMFFIRPPGCIL